MLVSLLRPYRRNNFCDRPPSTVWSRTVMYLDTSLTTKGTARATPHAPPSLDSCFTDIDVFRFQ